MPNPTSMDNTPAVLSVTSTEASIALNPDRAYVVKHDGEDNAGTPTTDIVYLSFAGTVDADASEGANKAKLQAGEAILIGPGVGTLYAKSATATGATLTIVPQRTFAGRY